MGIEPKVLEDYIQRFTIKLVFNLLLDNIKKPYPGLEPGTSRYHLLLYLEVLRSIRLSQQGITLD